MDNLELKNLIDELRALPKEVEWVEFKSGSATANDKLGEYISALSNAACIANQPFGYLIFGVEDEAHQVIGTDYNFKIKKVGNEELELWIRRLLSPSIQFLHFSCQYNERLRLEIFQIPAAKGEPTFFQRVPYIRFNSSVADLRGYSHYLKKIYNSEDDWSAKIIKDATIDDLEPDAIFKAREKFKEKKEGEPFFEEIDSWSNSTFLDKARITIGGKITNTAIILLGKTESSHFVSPAVAQITWKLDTEESAYEHFETPLFLNVNKVLSRIRNLKFKFFPDNELLSTEVNKYDTKVILEALNNCIAHQDYSLHSRILITEQINKLIFTSAGSFFEGKVEDYSLEQKTLKDTETVSLLKLWSI
jgi:ATP-dependent DNA helicase RecG